MRIDPQRIIIDRTHPTPSLWPIYTALALGVVTTWALWFWARS